MTPQTPTTAYLEVTQEWAQQARETLTYIAHELLRLSQEIHQTAESLNAWTAPGPPPTSTAGS